MAVKCNIAKEVLNKYNLKEWAMEADTTLDRAIVQNYVEHLGCNGLFLKGCGNDEDCTEASKAVIINCNLAIVDLSFQLDSTDPKGLSFYLGTGDIFGAKLPLTYSWSYDSNKLNLVGDAASSMVKFQVKDTRNPALIVTPITLHITDANGCTVQKTCTYTAGGINCQDNYVACYPVTNLRAQFDFIPCKASKTLTVLIHH